MLTYRQISCAGLPAQIVPAYPGLSLGVQQQDAEKGGDGAGTAEEHAAFSSVSGHARPGTQQAVPQQVLADVDTNPKAPVDQGAQLFPFPLCPVSHYVPSRTSSTPHNAMWRAATDGQRSMLTLSDFKLRCAAHHMEPLHAEVKPPFACRRAGSSGAAKEPAAAAAGGAEPDGRPELL